MFTEGEGTLHNPLSKADFFSSAALFSKLESMDERTHSQSTDRIYRVCADTGTAKQVRETGHEMNGTHKCDLVVLFMNWKIRLRLQKSILVGEFCFDANGQTDEQAHAQLWPSDECIP